MSGQRMHRTDDDSLIIVAIMAGDLDQLREYAQIVDDFPTGLGDNVDPHYWITDAVQSGPLDVIAWMLGEGVPIVFQEATGYTIVHTALYRDKPDKYDVLRLLIAAGADVNAHGNNDWTPAHLAAVRNDVPALAMLVEAGADLSIRTRIDDCETPLEEITRRVMSPEAEAYLRALSNPPRRRRPNRKRSNRSDT